MEAVRDARVYTIHKIESDKYIRFVIYVHVDVSKIVDN